ncbi:polysaccharide deacetylase family protein [Pareuzebyella sediminis]|uniref:polysaccharide deacetylase family protein n=1 Tax=Pareuzebyella sediminis TaxID=2607998 RepID=UPI0018E0DB3C|nr:polysaccharide deacetylase family protein [Pareuzebyella sediminis]
MLKRRSVNRMGLVLCLVLIVLSLIDITPWWSLMVLIIPWLCITALGSFMIRWNYHLESLCANASVSNNWVSITFDDGPNEAFTPRILKLLEAYNAKATFFCIGRQVEKHVDVLHTILDNGHTLGNHTYSHARSFGFFGPKKVSSELMETTELVEKITGKRMRLYRPAFGVTNPAIEGVVSRLQLKSIGWSVRSLDTTSRSKKKILNRIIGTVSKGDIILLHDTSDKTVAVLEQLLLFLERQNLRSVTVDQLLEIEAYA